jgi:predicted DCC family thiol-disulfide oxidoreductase YuxK
LDSAHRLEWRTFFDPKLYQEFPKLSKEECAKALHVVTPRGRIFSGAAAFGEMAKVVPALRLIRVFYNLPGACPVMEGIYNAIAKHRGGTCPVKSRRVDTPRKDR